MRRLIVILGIFLAACGQAPTQTLIFRTVNVEEYTVPIRKVTPQVVEVTRIVPQTVEVTRLITKIVEKKETVEVFLEATFTPVPTYTPLPTLEPVFVTATFTPVPDLQTEKTAGFYLVNIDIAPGIWRNNGVSGGCYWSVTTRTGDIIDNHFGMGGGTMYIPPNAFQVQLDAKCGTWTWLQP
jgi:hypothetical protein